MAAASRSPSVAMGRKPPPPRFFSPPPSSVIDAEMHLVHGWFLFEEASVPVLPLTKGPGCSGNHLSQNISCRHRSYWHLLLARCVPTTGGPPDCPPWRRLDPTPSPFPSLRRRKRDSTWPRRPATFLTRDGSPSPPKFAGCRSGTFRFASSRPRSTARVGPAPRWSEAVYRTATPSSRK